MTVPSETSRKEYAGNGGTTVFGTTFVFTNAADLVVKRILISTGAEILEVLGVGYTVSGGAGDVGNVTFVVAPSALYTVRIERTLAITQAVDLTTQGPFSPATITLALDRLTEICQMLLRRVSDLEAKGASLGALLAGNGLFFSGTTLHVGGGLGLQANADDVQVLYGSAGALAAVDKSAAGAGVANAAARVDHKHDITTAAPASISRTDDPTAEGTATTVARSDHRHQFQVPAAPLNITKAAAAAGVGAGFARDDHKHDVTTAAPLTITTANAEGAAVSLARSDHAHDHGALLGGDRHALAVAAVSHGFLSSSDKTKLDSLQTLFVAATSTTDGTIKTLATITPIDQATTVIEVTVVADRSTLLEAAGYKLIGTFRKKDGVCNLVGAVSRVHEAETVAGWDCVFTISGADILLQVTGAVASTVRWLAYGQTATQAG